MKKKLQKFFAMFLVLSLLMSLTAFASEPVVETKDNLDGTSTTTTTTETSTTEEGNLTVVVKVEDKVTTDNTTGETLYSDKSETVTEIVSNTTTDPETGSEVTTNTETIKSETNTKTDYTVKTDLPEVSTEMVAGETTTGYDAIVDAEVSYEEDENGVLESMEIEIDKTESSVTVNTTEIKTEENVVLESEAEDKIQKEDDKLASDVTDDDGNVVVEQENVAAAEQNVDLDNLRGITQHGYMGESSDLDALKAEVKAANEGASEEVLAALESLSAEAALAITQAALFNATNNPGADYESSDEAAILVYQYLMNTREEAIQVKENSLNLIIGDKVGETEKETTVTVDGVETTTTTTNDVYEGALNFSLTVVPTDKDELMVCLQYVDADGTTQTVIKALGKENNETTVAPGEDGSYTIGGLKLSENSDLQFDLKLEGIQNLTDGLYVYSDGTEDGTKQIEFGNTSREVNVNTSVSFSFNVDSKKSHTIKKIYEKAAVVYTESEIGRTKIASALDQYDMSEIKLTVGGAATSSVDVVFVLGGGMPGNKKTVESALNVFKPIMEQPGTTVKIGMLSLEKGQEVIVDLADEKAVLDPDTYEEFITEQFAYIDSLPAGSTNLHSQLVEAKRMLDADTSVKAENKYMFVVATGRTYYFDAENGKQATIVQKTTIKGDTAYTYGHYPWQKLRGGHTSLYTLPAAYKNNWNGYWAAACGWVEADKAAGDPYAYMIPLDNSDPASFQKWSAANSEDGKAYFDRMYGTWSEEDEAGEKKLITAACSSRIGSRIANPLPKAADFVSGQANGITSVSGHAMNYERAQYESANAYKALVDEGYNCYALCSETAYYQNNSPWIAQKGGKNNLQLGHSFMNHLATISGQPEAPVLWHFKYENGVNTWEEELDENFFAPIAASITQNVSIGSRVEDYMGYDAERNYNFDFVDDANSIKLTVGNKVYTTKKLPTANEGATSSYTFTAPKAEDATEDPKPTFTLDYYYSFGKENEHFVWTFGEEVVGNVPASLVYKEKLVNKPSTPGTYENLYTNQYAALFPKDSDGNYGDPLDFPMPSVEYTVTEVPVGSLTIEKKIVGLESDSAALANLKNALYFVVTDSNGNSATVNYAQFVPTDDYSGSVTIDLAPGAYSVAEYNAEVSGYTLTTTGVTSATVAVEEPALVSITNTYSSTGNGGGDNGGGGNGGGGNGGGGGGFYIPDEEPPLAELPEEDVPLAELPEEDVPLAELPEEEVPLALLPATGDASALWMVLSALSGAGLVLTRKKRDEE